MESAKNTTKYKKLLRTIIVSGGALLLNGLITLLLAPLISSTVGTEAYGFVSLAKNIAQYAVIAASALNSFASRYIVIAYHKDDLEEANTYFSSTVLGDFLLGTGLFALAMLFTLVMEKVLQISPAIVTDVKLLMFFVFVNFWLTTVTTAFSASGHIKNKLDMVGAFKALAYVCEAVILLLFYTFLPPRVFYVGIGLSTMSLVVAISNGWLCRRYTPELKVQRKHFSLRAIKRLVMDGIWTTLNSLGDTLNQGLDLLICNLMLTPLVMGQLALSKTFYAIFAGMFILVGQAFEPLYLKSYAKGDKPALLGDLKVAMKLSGMLSNIFFAGFVALGMSFYKLWIPDEDIALIYTLTVIGNMITIPGGSMQPLYYIYILTVKKKVPTLVTLAGGLTNVISMYFLIRYTSLGVYAVVWTTVFVMFVINFITNPLYMAHVLQVPWWTFYPNILRNVLSCLTLVIAFKGLSLLYTPSTWPTLVISAGVLLILGAMLHALIVFNRRDWQQVLHMLKGRRSK